MTRWRLRLAQWIAPAGADVHNPDETACPSLQAILEAADLWGLHRDGDGRAGIDVTTLVNDYPELFEETIDPDGNVLLALTDAGVAELTRLWGPDRVPPGQSGDVRYCPEHRSVRLQPGAPLTCQGHVGVVL